MSQAIDVRGGEGGVNRLILMNHRGFKNLFSYDTLSALLYSLFAQISYYGSININTLTVG